MHIKYLDEYDTELLSSWHVDAVPNKGDTVVIDDFDWYVSNLVWLPSEVEGNCVVHVILRANSPLERIQESVKDVQSEVSKREFVELKSIVGKHKNSLEVLQSKLREVVNHINKANK